MRATLLLIGFLGALATGNLFAADAAADVALKMVEQAVQPILAKLDPKPEVTRSDDGGTLVVAYKTQMFKIHGQMMTGEISPEAHDELGPGFQGFILKASVQDTGVANQAETPQTLREPYWRTYIDLTPLAGTQKQLYWGLAYGVRTDPDLLAQIRQKVKELGETAGEPASTR